MNKKRFFLIMEKDLERRFTFFEEFSRIPSACLNIQTQLKLSKLQTVLSRLTYKKKLVSEYNSVKPKLNELDELFISNPEGFIAKNIIEFIRRDFPKLKIISLQHGIFLLKSDSRLKSLIKKSLNLFSKLILGYSVVGEGFGPKSTDAYIVYNSLYKDHLKSVGWNDEEVIVSSFLLKGEVGEHDLEQVSDKDVVFFLQCLSKLGITTHEDEMTFIENIASKLSKKFDKVILKQHPFAKIDLPTLPKNCLETTEQVDMKDVGLIVSAFSTALLDYEKYNIPCVAIKYDKLNVDFSVYDQFLYMHEFDNNINADFDYIENEKRKLLPIFFEVGERSLESI